MHIHDDGSREARVLIGRRRAGQLRTARDWYSAGRTVGRWIGDARVWARAEMGRLAWRGLQGQFHREYALGLDDGYDDIHGD